MDTIDAYGQQKPEDSACRRLLPWFVTSGTDRRDGQDEAALVEITSVHKAIECQECSRRFERPVAGEGVTIRTAGPTIRTCFRVGLDGRGKRLMRTPDGSLHYHPQLSPDGRWLAYGSKRAGVRQLYVLRLADRSERHLTDLSGGRAAMWPRWQPDCGNLSGPLEGTAQNGRERLGPVPLRVGTGRTVSKLGHEGRGLPETPGGL
jgi:hypothetical protein